MSFSLKGIPCAVLGGDGREVEILRELKAEGADIRACGLPQEAEDVLCHPQASSVQSAVAGTRVIIGPIPLPQKDGSIFAPRWPNKLVLDEEALRPVGKGAIVVTGHAGPILEKACHNLQIGLYEYESDEELMVHRAPAIVEGAMMHAIQNTVITLHDSEILVTGFGKIGPAMIRTLIGMCARVTVAARNPIQLARAWEMGARTIHIASLPEHVQRFPIIFNIAPAVLLTRAVLEQARAGTVVIDLAAPPGGTDWEAARDLDIKAVWARGLGGRAPVTVGRSQWRGIRRILESAWEES